MHTRAARLGWSLWAVSMLAWVFHLVVWAAPGFTGASLTLSSAFVRVSFAISLGTLSTFGALIVARQPRNPIGWTAGVCGLLVALTWATGVYATSPVLAGAPAASAVAWVGNLFGANQVLIVPLLLLFPDGRVPSRAWRAVLWLAGAATVLTLISLALTPGPMWYAANAPNPLGVQELAPALGVSRTLGDAGLTAAVALSVVALIVRFRSARGDERLQLKWVIFACAIWVPALASIFFAPRAWLPVTTTIYSVVLLGFIIAFGRAILKYRLYEIDLVIGRTLVYGSLAIAIGLTYVGVVVGIGALVGAGEEPNIVLSLLATAIVALAFHPLRERVQRLANRLVYGERATPYAVLAGLSRRIGGALSVDEVLPQLVQAATQGVGGQRGRVRVYVPGGVDRAVAWPPETINSAFECTVPVFNQGKPVGEIAVSKRPGDAFTPSERALLEDVAAQAGPAFSNVRLTEELRASRQRIVIAQDAERRRIERDLHDGAQQHLVALSINLSLLAELTESDPKAACELLAEVRGQANEALTTLRDLARGIYPPALTDRGIGAALEGHLAKSHQSARLEMDGAAGPRRFAPEVEAAVYFCILEALQNCAKHAPGSDVRVRLSSTDEHLSFSVSDDGPGFDAARADNGSGLRGMADRLAAVDGSVQITSAPGGGTTVVGRVPVRGNHQVQALT